MPLEVGGFLLVLSDLLDEAGEAVVLLDDVDEEVLVDECRALLALLLVLVAPKELAKALDLDDRLDLFAFLEGVENAVDLEGFERVCAFQRQQRLPELLRPQLPVVVLVELLEELLEGRSY